MAFKPSRRGESDVLLSLITSHRYFSLHLPVRVEGRFFLEDPDTKEKLFQIDAEQGKWSLTPAGCSRFVDRVSPCLWSGMMAKVRVYAEQHTAYLYAENEEPATYAKFARCPVPDQYSLSFGAGSDNRFKSSNPYVATHHFRLVHNKGEWKVMDSGTKFGTYVNGKRIVGKESIRLHPGDMVSVLNQKFIVLPGMITFNAQGINTSEIKNSVAKLRLPDIKKVHPISEEHERTWFRRAPRFVRSMEEASLAVQAPPTQKVMKEDKQTTLLSYGPAVSSGLIMLLGGMNPIYGLGMAASSMLWPFLGKRRAEQLMQEEEEKRQQQYEEYISKVDQELEQLCSKQTETLKRHSISPRAEGETMLRDNKTMWSRRPEQADFLDIRMGTGDIPMKMKISFPQENEVVKSQDPMMDRLHEVEGKERILRNVPIMLPLTQFYTVGISGPEEQRNTMMEKIILQLAMHAGYDDLKICILGKLPERSKSLNLLPHTWDDHFQFHYIAENMDELNSLTNELESMISELQGSNIQRYNDQDRHLVILITDNKLAQCGIMDRMLFQHELRNVHVITLAEHSRDLPNRSGMMINLRSQRGRMIWQQGAESFSEDFIHDEPVTGVLKPIAEMMANTYLEMKDDAQKMPEVVPFLDLFGIRDVSFLNVLERWRRSNPTRTLRTPIGISEDGSLCQLDLNERGDGPHGLIAGTTGSGKSELIMSFILSAAINYSPEELSFVLIDYKGGGMAQAFENLPHTVGIITNLDGNELNRSLVSINSELNRRMQMLSDAERQHHLRSLNIASYQQLYRKGAVAEPLPYLVIITDEFAELKNQQPEFLQQLISAARIGRSLGVHLVLATQKPAGVVSDEIWSNSNFRICLRVQDQRDSQDMLKAPDAALLTRVGSFYKQVGYGESMVKAQSAWTGADYTPGAVALPSIQVDVLDHKGDPISQACYTTDQTDAGQSQLIAVKDHIVDTAGKVKLRLRKLWLPPLEEKISLSALYQKYGVTQSAWQLNPVVGELDDPSNQKRALVRMNISDGKNTIVYGAYGSGKLQFLTCVLEDLMKHHTPDELQMYILDYADDGLNVLKAAPHVGDVLFSDDDEKLIRFVKMMKDIIAKRKRILGGVMAAGSLEDRMKSTNTCHILIVIHHLLTLQERAEEQFNELKRIISEGPRYGIHFLATAETGVGLRVSITQLFARKYVLQMDQDDEYGPLLGRTGGMKPAAVRGRGLLREDDKLYEFQTATNDENLPEFCKELKKNWNGICAESIHVMPEQVTAQDLDEFIRVDEPLKLPVGLATENIEPQMYDLGDRVIHTVIGNEADTSEFLAGLLPMAASKGTEIVVFDINNDLIGFDDIFSLDMEDTASMINQMYAECQDIYARLQQGEEISGRRCKFIVMPNFRKLMDNLGVEEREKLIGMLKRSRTEWNWKFVIGDTAQNLNRHMIEEWFASVSKQDAICLGMGMAQQNFLQVNASTHELYENVAYPIGYVVRGGKLVRTKFLSGRLM